MNSPRVIMPTDGMMIISVSIGQWSGRKKDKARAARIEAEAGARRGTFSGSKALGDMTPLAKIQTVVGRARHLLAQGAVFSDGQYMFPSGVVMDRVAELEAMRAEFMALVDAFVRDYDQWVEGARNYVGDLCDRREYPTAEYVRSKFYFNIRVVPVPKVGTNPILGVTEDIRAALQNEIDRSISEIMGEAKTAAAANLETQARDLARKLTDSRLYDTAIPKLKIAAEVAAGLGVPEGNQILGIVSVAKPAKDLSRAERSALAEKIWAIYPPEEEEAKAEDTHLPLPSSEDVDEMLNEILPAQQDQPQPDNQTVQQEEPSAKPDASVDIDALLDSILGGKQE